jgi:MYXO-CTERM domain-containing protein
VPESGRPPELVPGRDYYLYASADVLYPISRCIFTAGEPAPAACASAGSAEAGALALAGLAFALRRRRRD